jgi:hypothetical protein
MNLRVDELPNENYMKIIGFMRAESRTAAFTTLAIKVSCFCWRDLRSQRISYSLDQFKVGDDFLVERALSPSYSMVPLFRAQWLESVTRISIYSNQSFHFRSSWVFRCSRFCVYTCVKTTMTLWPDMIFDDWITEPSIIVINIPSLLCLIHSA